MSDDSLTAVVLKGLPESFKPFTIHVTQSDETMMFADFKTKFRSFEGTEKMSVQPSMDNVVKIKAKTYPASTSVLEKRTADIVCFKCGTKGHKVRTCQRKQWCSFCKSSTHRDANCRRRRRQDNVRQVSEEQRGNTAYAFLTKDRDLGIHPGRGVKKGLMIDAGATSLIITDETMFKSFDESFRAETHCVELADRTMCQGVAKQRGVRKCS